MGSCRFDAYTVAVEVTALDLGAEVMVTESLAIAEGGYQASVTLRDLIKDKQLDAFTVKLDEPASDSAAGPLIFREPADGPALIIPRPARGARNPTSALFPSCEKCPEPQYTEEARIRGIQGIVLLVVTVTEQGTADQISVIRGVGGLTDVAVETVRHWRFKPAVGPDGKPFATRTPMEVNFRLLNH